jgi:hypothetical protein
MEGHEMTVGANPRGELAEAATRALCDREYALAILRGDEDQPEVRNAILAEMVQARDTQLATLPEDAANHLRTYLHGIDPANDPQIFESFINLRSPAGAFLVSLGANLSCAPW